MSEFSNDRVALGKVGGGQTCYLPFYELPPEWHIDVFPLQALDMELHPLYLMLPVCVAASFAFMLPVATPPNALVFATGVLTIKDMVSTS